MRSRIYLGDSARDVILENASDYFWDLCTGISHEPKKIRELSIAITNADNQHDFNSNISSVLGDELSFQQENAKIQLSSLCYNASTAAQWIGTQSAYNFGNPKTSRLALKEIQTIINQFSVVAFARSDEIAEYIQGKDMDAYDLLQNIAKDNYMLEAGDIKGAFTQKILEDRAQQQQVDQNPKAKCCIIL